MRTLLLVISLVLVTTLPAAAATRSLIFTPSDLGSTNSAAYTLTEDTVHNVYLAFKLPADFKKDSTAKLVLTLINNSSVTACNIYFGVAYVDIRRGALIATGGPSAVGISSGSPITIALPAIGARNLSYNFKGPSSGPILGLRKGDHVTVRFDSNGTQPDVTCALAHFSAAEFRYKTP